MTYEVCCWSRFPLQDIFPEIIIHLNISKLFCSLGLMIYTPLTILSDLFQNSLNDVAYLTGCFLAATYWLFMPVDEKLCDLQQTVLRWSTKDLDRLLEALRR